MTSEEICKVVGQGGSVSFCLDGDQIAITVMKNGKTVTGKLKREALFPVPESMDEAMAEIIRRMSE